MDLFSWVVLGVAVAAWATLSSLFSLRRHADKRRGVDPEAAAGMNETERQIEQGRARSGVI